LEATNLKKRGGEIPNTKRDKHIWASEMNPKQDKYNPRKRD
jgi:hypothetical protein